MGPARARLAKCPEGSLGKKRQQLSRGKLHYSFQEFRPPAAPSNSRRKQRRPSHWSSGAARHSESEATDAREMAAI